MGQGKIIFEGPHLLVVSKEREIATDTVLVTFNEYGHKPNGATFWGDQLLDKLPVSGVGVVSRKPNWYPQEDMQAALPAMRAAIGGRKAITYGFSQGAYGALKYAAALGARGALAFSPQISINPATVPFDRRYHGDYKAELHNGELILPGEVVPNSFVFYDPHNTEDRLNAAILLGYPGVSAVLCPFTGHESIRQITGSGASQQFLETALRLVLASASDSAVQLRSLIRATRRQSGLYQEGLAKALAAKGRVGAIARMQDKGMKIGLRGRWELLKREAGDGGLDKWLMSASYAELDSIGVVSVWNVVRAEHLAQAEARLADLIVSHAPNNVFLLLHAVNSYISLKHPAAAKAVLSHIVLHFGVRHYTDHIRDFAQKLELKGLQQIIAELS